MVREKPVGDDHAAVTAAVHDVILGCLPLDPSALTDDAGLRAGTWTSIQHLSVLMAAANRFGFPLDPQVVRDVNTVGDLVRHTMEAS